MRATIVVPSFNNGRTLGTVLEGLVQINLVRNREAIIAYLLPPGPNFTRLSATAVRLDLRKSTPAAD